MIVENPEAIEHGEWYYYRDLSAHLFLFDRDDQRTLPALQEGHLIVLDGEALIRSRGEYVHLRPKEKMRVSPGREYEVAPGPRGATLFHLPRRKT